MLLLFPLQRLKFSKRKGTRTRQNESKKQPTPQLLKVQLQPKCQ